MGKAAPIIFFGSIASALLAIAAFAGPVLRPIVGGPLPYASNYDLAQAQQTLQQQQQTNQRILQQLQTVQRQADFSNLGQLEFQLQLTLHEAGNRKLSLGEEQFIQSLRDQIAAARARLNLPPGR